MGDLRESLERGFTGSEFVGAEEGRQMLSGPDRDPEILAMVRQTREEAHRTLDRLVNLRERLNPVLHRDDESLMKAPDGDVPHGPIETPLGEELWQVLGPLQDMNRVLNDIEGRLEV